MLARQDHRKILEFIAISKKMLFATKRSSLLQKSSIGLGRDHRTKIQKNVFFVFFLQFFSIFFPIEFPSRRISSENPLKSHLSLNFLFRRVSLLKSFDLFYNKCILRTNIIKPPGPYLENFIFFVTYNRLECFSLARIYSLL